MEGDHDYRVDRVEERRGRVLVAFSWADRHGRRHSWAHVLKIKAGRIVDMQDFASPTIAALAARVL
jgi:hypothetical protein